MLSSSAGTASPGASLGAAHGGDLVPVGAGPHAELEPAVAEQVEAGGGAREYCGRAQRGVQHVRAQADRLGPRGDVGEQGPGVEVGRLIGMVLERGQVEPGLLGEFGERDDPSGAAARGLMNDPKSRSWP